MLIKPEKKDILNNTAIFIIIAVLSFILALKGLFQLFCFEPRFNGINMVGWYDNSAGFAATLCASIPFSLFFLKTKGALRYVSILFIIISSLTIIFSFSRSGILSLGVTFLFYLFNYYVRKRKKIFLLGSVVISSILIAGLYFIKIKSAKGRILIWKCSFSMIADRPVFGFGSGGFNSKYMYYQSEYFKNHIDSKYEMLADSIDHPYNEYILFIVNYGIVGFLVLMGFGYFVWKSYCRCPQHESFIAGLCLISVAVFSLFSYPFAYPFIWVLCGLSISIIVVNAKYSIVIPLKYVRIACLFIIISTIFIASGIISRMIAEIEWSKIARNRTQNNYHKIILRYSELYPVLKNNPQFLYNYAAVLNHNKDYKRSLFIANKCNALFSNYDLEMLIGDNLFGLNKYFIAEHYYLVSSHMCPSRFFPLYQLSKVYDATGNKSKLLNICKEIINKPVKVESLTIVMMKNEMKLKYESLKRL
ncbi:O-antigen ligase family protein [Pedobacter borealis]|uniref:O-antigen ligase family protein n=1 Tax=Pedobacter borealis TaxID=475254 RepID=UPI001428A977|nr:O-antigen ligase family protein [Pedobacter borealis]